MSMSAPIQKGDKFNVLHVQRKLKYCTCIKLCTHRELMNILKTCFFVTHMFSKDHQSIKLLGQSKDEPRVVHEIVDWSLISSVEE